MYTACSTAACSRRVVYSRVYPEWCTGRQGREVYTALYHPAQTTLLRQYPALVPALLRCVLKKPAKVKKPAKRREETELMRESGPVLDGL